MTALRFEPPEAGRAPADLSSLSRRLGASALAPPRSSPVADRGAFGCRMAEAFNVSAAPTLTTSVLKRAQMAVTWLRSTGPACGFTSPVPVEKAYLVTLHLQAVAHGALWIGGLAVHAGAVSQGSTSIVHLEDEPVYHFGEGFDCLQFYVPDIVFDELATRYGAPAISRLSFQADVIDRVLQQLGSALLPSLCEPGPIGIQFFDHIALAIYSHLALTYGQSGDPACGRSVGLSPAQERRAKALLIRDLTREPSISDASTACGLTPGQFVRAFRHTTGMPPHRWLRQFRVERAKELLFGTRLSLAEIAYDCGFADQSHFTRVFTASIGVTPGAWRRQRRS